MGFMHAHLATQCCQYFLLHFATKREKIKQRAMSHFQSFTLSTAIRNYSLSLHPHAITVHVGKYYKQDCGSISQGMGVLILKYAFYLF